ncbi:Eco57I restriction-modification methylase domain-containing protein [Prevotella melaninogenica]|uniref:Eco57I restriction-modification methylase domain-containing protein n=2 Tax=Prevotella TaxID=838 RepID=UPI0001AEA788|nr:Eco57I restriction-modification methylase domain-containing protein [Prevotella melaninogenica]ADK95251.1 Eco57I restriction endonuclease [Prevotella melaninogenica ATCC 25845]ASE17382.1 DEAD/DEAH box helicase [Prevotella melaninogenica]UEB08344.1 Eco57I restriction-modification methylase domain-containing protein [Prevotella melaninogenica]
MATFESSLKPRLIYVFAIADKQHEGSLKIGETTLGDDTGDTLAAPNSDVLNQAAKARIDQYTKTAGISYELLHTELTFYIRGGHICSFNDKQVHNVLERSGVKRKEFKGATEWYSCDLETVKRAIAAIKEGKDSLGAGEVTHTENPIILRPEQKDAVERTLKQFRRGNQMLWNAKMRFGKTLCALRVAKEMGAVRTIIVTHRPVVDASWFEDFGKTFHDSPEWHYGSHNKGESFASLQRLAGQGKKYVYFASMQDMRGSKEVGGKFDKNNEIFSTTWDLVIVDEAHEGTQTELGKAVLEQLISKNTKILRLSGTPFNLLDDHKEEEVFTWDYVMEQKAKIDWEINHLGDTNPYASLPAIHIYTYDLGRLMSEYSDEEKAFNFREFFRTREDGSFVHERDIDHFLTLLTTDDEESLYPYSNDSFRQIFRHTLWILPGVKAAKALSRKLAKHPVFGLFNVVNVAGDGDEEEESRDALELVNKAIGSDPDQSYTITLSCGRLTTGVSVKPWTGVFMMAGAYSTSAAGYMQTIFRVQTPYTHNGRMKTDCYAFDFAPDRTLRVLAETAKVSHKAGKQTEDDRKLLGDFLNFCPIIAIDGGQMKQYKVETMLAQLKRAQIEKVVQDGFENGALYNDELLKLTDVELKEFDDLKGIIGKTKAMPKSGDIDINRQGLTNEQYEEKEQLEKKKKKDLTPEEKKRLDELKAKGDQRREAISILRGISIRMPLMLYGAEMVDEDKELTIDNFAKLMDDQSWEEFMPRGVTKQVFARFKRYYDPDIFREAGKRIREMARMADKFTIEERIARLASIFATFRNPDKETVLTPWRVVNMHLGDSLGGYCFMNEDFTSNLDIPRYIEHKGVTTEVFHPQSVILEINSKSGLYPLYAAYNIYRTRLEQAREKYGEVNRATALMLWDLTLEENIFVVCKTPMARYITMRTLRGFRNTNVHTKYYPNLIESIITEPDSVVNMLRSGKRFWKINNDENMKIDAIIGNPPYQVTSENTSDAPVYHLFIDLASLLAQRVSLLTPARYLFNAGKTPKDWNTKILNDEHFKVVDYWANSTDVFPTVDIKGGVAVMYRDSKLNFGKIGTFTAYKKLNIIANKVCKISENGLFAELIYAPESYRLSDKLHEDYPWAKERLSMGHPYDITTNIFEKLPEIFKETYQIKEEEVRFYGRYKNERCYRWIKREYVDFHPNLDKYKVIVPKSNGSGAIGEVLSSPLIGEPLIGVTQTFLTIGAFDTRTEAEACLKYVKTKFARTMLGLLKATQHNPKDTWRLVPLQDFTAASDIDWTLSVAEIDQQLYHKYGLEAEEIAFIEEKVRAMG